MALIKKVRSLSKRLITPFLSKKKNKKAQESQQFQTIRAVQIRRRYRTVNRLGRWGRRMTNPPGDIEQPSKGDIQTLHSNRNPTPANISNEATQEVLTRKRRQFIATLPRSHVLRERVLGVTGELVSDHHQPRGRVRSIASSPEEARLRRRSKKSREDTEGPDMVMERNRFREMWNGIGGRIAREEEWMEFDRVKNKLLSLKRKHCFSEADLQDERELDRKRAKSRRRSQRERTRDTSGSEEDKGGEEETNSATGVSGSSQARRRGTPWRLGRGRHFGGRRPNIPPVVKEDNTQE